MVLSVIAAAFILVLPVELPDKTLFATLVLATRFAPLPVFVGVGTAFGLQVAIAVTAGSLLSLLPEALVSGVVAVLFLVGAVILWRSASSGPEDEDLDETAGGPSFLRAAAISFGVLFAAEWGDLSQLATAGLAARTMSRSRCSSAPGRRCSWSRGWRCSSARSWPTGCRSR